MMPERPLADVGSGSHRQATATCSGSSGDRPMLHNCCQKRVLAGDRFPANAPRCSIFGDLRGSIQRIHSGSAIIAGAGSRLLSHREACRCRPSPGVAETLPRCDSFTAQSASRLCRDEHPQFLPPALTTPAMLTVPADCAGGVLSVPVQLSCSFCLQSRSWHGGAPAEVLLETGACPSPQRGDLKPLCG